LIISGKTNVMHVHCPNCKNDSITIYNKRRYFITAAIFLGVVLVCYLLSGTLGAALIIATDLAIAVIGILALGILCFIYGLYYLIKGLLIKQTSYQCKGCKHRF
jgi:hypothetical protein